MKKMVVHTTATAVLLSQLGMTNSALANTNETTVVKDTLKQEDPSFVKGDFLHFVKTIVEKIQLLLTTNKVKEAESLAEFAGERIHEARVFIKEGKEDLANETMKEAVTKMEMAQKEVDVPFSNIDDTTNTNIAMEDKDTTLQTAKTETEKETKKLTKEQKEIAKIQLHLNNNLLVLANVLDQVKNPKAKASIANNIEKSFNKIGDKLENLLKIQKVMNQY